MKKVSKGSKFVKNVKGTKKKNSAKGQYMQRDVILAINIYVTQKHSKNCFTALIFYREVKYYLNFV